MTCAVFRYLGYEIGSKEGDDASIESHEGTNEHISAYHHDVIMLVEAGPGVHYQKNGKYDHSPALHEAQSALDDIKKILHPPRNKGPGYDNPGLDKLLHSRLEGMRHFLWAYINPQSSTHGAWGSSSIKAADDLEKGTTFARKFREWSRAFLADREDIPFNPYGKWNESVIDRDATLAQDIHLHLQGIGLFVKALDLIDFMDTPDMRARSGRTKRLCISAAQRWMRKLEYRWTINPKGQYVDGHEREDVVAYRQLIFLPAWSKIKSETRDWTASQSLAQPQASADRTHTTVVWFHNESTFYANDRKVNRWVHVSETANPYAKGEGPSQMVADMVSADYGWLRSPDGSETAWVLFKAGKNRNGYFTNDDILNQANNAMDILAKHFPNENHVLVFDNATTHAKRADGALSASKMPKNISNKFLVEVNVHNEARQLVYSPNRKIMKKKIRMEDAQFADGSKQALYFEPGHPQDGLFKGMSILLEERGMITETKLLAQCKDFKYVDKEDNCCQRRTLYNQPDFVQVKSLLEITCEARGFTVLFIPKFHFELNFIEQCWGFAKRRYHQYPASSKEADLERNVISALESVPLESMRR